MKQRKQTRQQGGNASRNSGDEGAEAGIDLDASTECPDAHETALELLKQLITLASGVLALSATFLEKLATLLVPLIVVLGLAWLALVVSVFFGLEAISAIVKSRLDSAHRWSEGYGKTSARISKYAFVLGILLFASFALLVAIRGASQKVVNPTSTRGGYLQPF